MRNRVEASHLCVLQQPNEKRREFCPSCGAPASNKGAEHERFNMQRFNAAGQVFEVDPVCEMKVDPQNRRSRFCIRTRPIIFVPQYASICLSVCQRNISRQIRYRAKTHPIWHQADFRSNRLILADRRFCLSANTPRALHAPQKIPYNGIIRALMNTSRSYLSTTPVIKLCNGQRNNYCKRVCVPYKLLICMLPGLGCMNVHVQIMDE